MMLRHLTLASGLAAGLLMLAGCHDSQTGPRRDVTPPTAPRGVFSVTGDHRVWLYWDQNPETDVVAYRIYEGPCDDCLYTQIGGTSGLSLEVDGLANGVTRYFAVSAVDRAGNESDLSYNSVFDTPRPEGFGLAIFSVEAEPDFSGYDFSAYDVVPYDDSEVDIIYTVDGGWAQIVAPFVDTDIQDMGPTASLDDIDWAPNTGWSPSGTVEAIPGHAYVVWTWDDHYAKFRVVSATGTRVIVDWAYQVDPGNRELKARRAIDEDGQPAPRVRRAGIVASR
jgi:hypothetical protein